MSRRKQTLISLILALAYGSSPGILSAAGPAPVDLLSTAHFVILAGAAITTTGGGIINGDIGASPIAGSAIGVPCAEVNGTIFAVDASGPPCAVINSTLLTTAKGDLTTAYNDAAGRIPIPSGPNLNPGLIPGSGNIGGMNLAPGLYKFTVTALITGSDVTLTGGPDDVWIFQCAQDLQLGSGIKVILAGGARAKNIFWQVGTSAVLGTSSVFNGTILASQSITMNTSSTIDGRALASSAGVTFNGIGAVSPNISAIGVQQPPGTNLVNGVGTNDFGSVAVGTNLSVLFTITNSGNSNLTVLNIVIDGTNSPLFSVTTNPIAPVSPNGSTTFTVSFAPLTPGVKTAALHIANNDINNNPFTINLAGNATNSVSGFGVQAPPGTNMISGGSTNNFGSVAVGTNSPLAFTITNTGSTVITGLRGAIDGVDSALFSISSTPSPTLQTNGSTTFTVEFAPLSTGLKNAALEITDDTGDSPFKINLIGIGTGGNMVASTNIFVIAVSPVTLNPQTGLFEQTVSLTNSGLSTVSAVRLLIQALPPDVQLYYADGSTNGAPYVQWNFPLAPATEVDFLIQYYRPNRQVFAQPAFVPQETSAVFLTVTGSTMPIDRFVQLSGGRFLIEFSAIPGGTYAIQYSTNMSSWTTVIPTVTAPANRVQWYDDGPPKTESKPNSVASRFYRVVLIP